MTILPNSWKRRLLKYLLPTGARVSYNQQHARRTNHDMSVDDVFTAINSAENGDIGPLIGLGVQMIADDSQVRTEFSKRKLAVLGDPFDVMPYDKANADDVAACKAVKAMIEDCDEWDDGVKALLEACLYPVAVVEKIFAPASDGARYRLTGLRRLDPELFDYTTGSLRVKDTVDGVPTGSFHEPEPARYIIHRGDPICLPDQKGGLIRPLLWWYFVKTKDREWWVQFLERFGAPFMVGRYDEEDEASQLALEDAFSRASRLFGVTVTKETEIELHEANTTGGGEAFERLHRTANEEISKLILGQFGTSQGVAAGLNGNSAGVLDGVRQDYKFYDALQLGGCLRRDIFRQFLRSNALPGRPPRCVWGDAGKDDNAAFANRLVSYRQAGLRLSEASIKQVGERESVGFEWERDERMNSLSADGRPVPAATPRPARDLPAASRFALLDVPDDDPFLTAMLAAATQPQ